MLKKELGLLDIFCIASGAMISSGIFILPALAYAKTGPAMIISYILAGILILPAMLAQAELTTAMPKAGGVYFFIERSMGAPIGSIGGLASWFSLSFKSAFALVGIGIFATLINPGITEAQIKLIAVGCCLFFMFVNIIGVKQTGRFQIALVLSLIGILLLYILRGFLFIQPNRFTPFVPFGWVSVFATAGLVFVSFGGLTKISCVAEEVKNPGRNIPLGMFLAFCVVIILYAAVVFVTVGLLDSAQFSNSLVPLSLGASTFMGNPGGIILAIAALLAFISTANAGILTASRNSLAMSRDSLLPKIFERINARSKTPHFSIIFTTAFMIVVILFLSLENLVKTASTLMILLFMFVNLSLIIMRESKIQGYRPKFRSPLYPWVQILAILGYGFLIFEMGRVPLSITAIFISCGLAWYLLYARKRVNRQAAMVHVIERITARELVDATLPDELRGIIIERDEIVEDRFDHLIKKCEILDYEPPTAAMPTAESMFKIVANILSRRLEIDKKTLFDLFIEREKQTSTVIAPGLAIPHIIIKGVAKFDILIVRCKKGIIFPDTPQPVHTIFVLVGSRDERNFHLRALAAIAQIAQGKNFDKRWLDARNAEELRDIILLAERKRIGIK
ncbi:MAG: amino acid permease [Candidatus Omnitrophota bacterium]|nr:MAG: amino acid permease [Candidatus Omnitrophota bacterium]